MFRQILITPEDRDLQRIIWREKPGDPISEYQLNTVTYGTASATYLAVRTMIQLARDEGHLFPIASEVLLRDFYMDDLLSGGDSVEAALQIQSQITELLAKGGMNIRKWTSNCKEITEQIPEDLRESGDWLLNPEATIKTLGIVWNPQRDEFRIRLNIDDFLRHQLTKRILLSYIATIFDPLGFLAPISFTCKTWMQQLWKEVTDWDQPVSADIEQKWTHLRNELPLINEMVVPRWIQFCAGNTVQIHGFCDASEKGYAAVIYSRIIDSHGLVHIRLLTAKSKVAPLKHPPTLPRMELAGALLLARLTRDSLKTLDIPQPEIFYWCDSQIALAWISKPASNWTTFVANRVSLIQQMSSLDQWHYINTKENPADVASRGCLPSTLQNHHLWWTGPSWLRESPETWPSNVKFSTDLEHKPVKTTCLLAKVDEPSDAFLNRYSSFHKLTRITAWILRFKTNASKKSTCRGPLQAFEIRNSRYLILRLLQQLEFNSEFKSLLQPRTSLHHSRFQSLAPFIDSFGLLRVGGRLRNSFLPNEAKHPILLPRQHPLTRSIILETHHRTLHGGAQLTLSVLRRSYWLSNGRSTVQSVIRSCIRCRRFAAASRPQQMGDLPSARITAAPPFYRTGVDYCGPFLYRCSKGRGIKTTKGYIAVFVCFSTKAVHLELVSDLTTDAYLAAFKRFVARRNLPLEVHSDNGTNFRGASCVIDQQLQEAVQEATELAASQLANDGVTWNFIPASSPHLGGLWEAGVKSVKTHLKRVLDNTKLTYEEFSTVLCQIEACLNSRPLCPVSNDPEDISALTPGHFLTTRPLLAPPEPAILDANPVKRWNLLTKLHQSFWQRWSSEYLSQMQQRTKWKNVQADPVVGDLVLLKERGLPPAKWPLGRITALHPGSDQRVRLVTIRTKGNTQVKQPMVNLCLLPNSNDEKPEIESNKAELPERLCHAALTRSTAARSRPYHTQTAIITILFLFMTAFHLGSATPLVNVQPGLYLERLGHCQLKSGILRLQIDYPIAEMNGDEQHLNDLNKNLSSLFNHWHFLHDVPPAESSLYQQMIERFQRKCSLAVERINELKSTRQRSRRGLFGKLMTTVFGVNDDVYAELSVLRKEQIVNSQNNLWVTTTVEKSLHDMQLRRQEVDENLRRTSALIQSLSVVAHRHTIANHLMAAYTVASSFLDDLSYKYETLAKAAIGLGSILDFLPLKHINEALRNATDRLPIGLYVRPVPEDHLDAHFASEKLILRAYFPIAATDLFDLVHVTPIPDFRNDTFIVPDLTSRTIALNYLDQTFFELNEGQLAACRLMSARTYLCETSMLSVMNFTSCSILNEIYNRTSPQPCPHTALHINGVLWQKLLMPNAWLFTTHSVTVVAMICQSKREDLRLVGSGIIQLPDGCIIKTPSYNIGSLVLVDVHVLETFVKAVTISDFPPVIRNRIELLDPPPFTNPSGLVADIPIFNSTIAPYEPPHLGLHFTWSAIVILVVGLGYLREEEEEDPAESSPHTTSFSALVNRPY